MISHIMTQSDKLNNTTDLDSVRVVYTHKGITYELLDDKRDERPDWKEQVVRDFLHCERIGDWNTIKNRIANGLKWGWLREITDSDSLSV